MRSVIWCGLAAGMATVVMLGGCQQQGNGQAQYPDDEVIPIFEPTATGSVTEIEPRRSPSPAPATAPVFEPVAPAPAAAQSMSGQNYVVQRGDTLWSISRRVYGDGRRWQEIARANNITDERKISVGQRLIIP